LEILVGAQSRIIVTDAALHRDNPFVVGKYLDVPGPVRTGFRIDCKVDPAGLRRWQFIAAIDDGHRARPAIETRIVLRGPALLTGDQSTHLVDIRAKPDRRAFRLGRFGIYFGGRDIIGLDRREKLAVVQPKRQKRAEITLRARYDLTFPLRYQIAVVATGNGIGEPDGKSVPDTLIVRHALIGLLPYFRAFAAIFLGLRAKGFDAQFQRLVALEGHV